MESSRGRRQANKAKIDKGKEVEREKEREMKREREGEE